MGDFITQQQVSHQSHDAVVQQYSQLVKRIAYHLRMHLPQSILLDDLIQAGMLGLLEAAKHYDASKGASFETYAGIRIRGSMLDEVRSNEWVPRSVYRNSRLINEAIKKVENRLGREAKDKEIADEMQLELDEYYELSHDSLSSHLYGFEDLGIDEARLKNEATNSNEPHERVLHDDLAQHLADLVKNLPRQEQLVLALYYERDLNLKEIGDVLEVSESRVSQIHSQAMAHLKKQIVNLP